MSNRFKNMVFILVLLVVVDTGSFAQQESDSLDNYLEIAARANPLIRSKYAGFEASLREISRASSLPDPTMDVGFFFRPMELVNGNEVADIRLMQMFPWFGVLKNSKDEAALKAKAQYEEFRDARDKVFLEVRRQWYRLLLIDKKINVLEEQTLMIERIDSLSLSAIAGKRISATGASGMSDLASALEIKAEIEDLKAETDKLKIEKTAAEAGLNILLNRPGLTSVSLPDRIRIDTSAWLVNSGRQMIEQNNPGLRRLVYLGMAYDSRGKVIKGTGMPVIGLGVDYSIISKKSTGVPGMNGSDMIMPMVSVTLPVFRTKYRAMIAENGLLEKANGLDYEDMLNDLGNEYNMLVAEYLTSLRDMERFSYQTDLAEKTYRIMIGRLASSGDGMEEILKVRIRILDSEIKYLEAATSLNMAAAAIRRIISTDRLFEKDYEDEN